jgi:hypothetical protein
MSTAGVGAASRLSRPDQRDTRLVDQRQQVWFVVFKPFMQDAMTPEHLDQIETGRRGFTEFECRQCKTILIYGGIVLEPPMIDGLCDECHQASADSGN